MMKAGENQNTIPARHKQQGVGESSEDRLSHLPVDFRERFREASDASGGRINRPHELGPEAGHSLLVPSMGVEKIETRLRSELEAHRASAALQEFLTELRPGDHCVRVGGDRCQPAIQF